MFRPNQQKMAKSNVGYAKPSDFCEIFKNDTKPLYLLAFLLTADHQRSERCFLSTLEDASNEQSVFKEFAASWVRRKLIENAIKVVSPASGQSNEKRDLWDTRPSETPTECAVDTVTKLNPFHRFVFVMSFVERYSRWECALLLNSRMSNAAQAQMKALRRLPDLAPKQRTVKGTQRSHDLASIPTRHQATHRDQELRSMEV